MAGIYVRDDIGGSDLTRLDAALIFEALSHGCPATASFLSIHNMCAWMIDTFGSEDMRQVWGPQLCTMDKVASYCLTEPGSGSDAAALKTTAKRDGDRFVLNGTKSFISGGGVSDLYIVMARTGEEGPKGISAILVEKGTDGLSYGANEKKMGWNVQPTSEVVMNNVRVPVSNLLGTEGDGFKYAMKGLDGGRLNIAASALGAAQAALDKTLSYMEERKAFGKSINQFQALQFRLADMEIELQAARTFLYKAAWTYDQGLPEATKYCAMAKRFVTDTAFDVANQALQLHGGYGYLADYGIEKIVRDLRVHQILEGTNEIMRMIVARQLLSAK
jgi:alkylation response protein AidB-like acyl-CoA dehydrogenase